MSQKTFICSLWFEESLLKGNLNWLQTVQITDINMYLSNCYLGFVVSNVFSKGLYKVYQMRARRALVLPLLFGNFLLNQDPGCAVSYTKERFLSSPAAGFSKDCWWRFVLSFFISGSGPRVTTNNSFIYTFIFRSSTTRGRPETQQ